MLIVIQQKLKPTKQKRLRPLFFEHKFIVNASNLIHCKLLYIDTVAANLGLEVEVKN